MVDLPRPHNLGTVGVDHVVGGRYVLLRRLAVGGMGAVWVAADNVLGRDVAVKILRDDLVDSGVFLDRFRNEARHTAALAHPGIANVFDYGEDEDDGRVRAYLVMELVQGRPLSDILASGDALPVATALSVLAQTADALHAAHLNGVIHRDVKPGNLLMREDGTIKVTDFGIARAADTLSITEAGTVVGTARYMSPEQAMGAPATPASDLYSLGIVGYEMLVGTVPFTAASPGALAMAHVHQAPPPMSSTVPEGVRNLIAAALAKDPLERPADAHQFATEARRLLVASGQLRDPAARTKPPTLCKDMALAAAGTATAVLVHEPGVATAIVDEFDTGEPTQVAPRTAGALSRQRLVVAEGARVSGGSHRTLLVLLVTVLAVIAAAAMASRSASGNHLPFVGTTKTTLPASVVTSLPASSPTAVVAPVTTVASPLSSLTTVAPKVNPKGHGNGKPKG